MKTQPKPIKKKPIKLKPTQPKRRRKGLKRNLLLAFLGLVLLIGGLTSLSYEALRQPVLLAQPVAIDIPAGMRFRQIAFLLAEKHIWVHPYLMAAYAKFNKLDGKIKAGYYEFEGNMQPIEVLENMVAGKVKPFHITLVEGQTLQQWLQQLQQVPELKHTLPPADKSLQTFKQHLGLHDASLEGWFYPDTYQFSPGTTDQEILSRAYRSMQEVLNTAWAKRAPDLPYQSPYEALIMASIIEKETAQPTERTRVSGVFINRLRLDMKLQTDPTVIYGLGDTFQGNLTREHLKLPSAFNTYLNKGLPPTPIAMVSAASLAAALHPEPTDALYFVAKSDGFHVFSATLKAHNDAVQQYQISHAQP